MWDLGSLPIMDSIQHGCESSPLLNHRYRPLPSSFLLKSPTVKTCPQHRSIPIIHSRIRYTCLISRCFLFLQCVLLLLSVHLSLRCVVLPRVTLPWSYHFLECSPVYLRWRLVHHTKTRNILACTLADYLYYLYSRDRLRILHRLGKRNCHQWSENWMVQRRSHHRIYWILHESLHSFP